MSIKDQLRIVGNYLEIKQSNSYIEVLRLDKIQKIEYIKDRSLTLMYEGLVKNEWLNSYENIINQIYIRSDNYDEAYNLIINALGSLNSKIPPIVPDDYETKSM